MDSSAAFLTYEPFYGLREKPFSLKPDPRFLYKTLTHAAAHDDLREAIRRREGLIVLTGDIGTGKTTLCRSVLDHLDRKTFSTFVPDPFVTREDLLKMLLIDFGVMSVDDLKSGRLNGASRPELSYPLYEFLNSLVPLQAFAVLVIDEAQNLSLPLLEELRILSDLQGSEKLLQVVLIGQLELQTKLKLPEMRQLDQRVVVRCRLDPLNRANVAGYIAHRLHVAGAGADRIEFSEGAIDAIFDASRGVPRLINLICDRALREGFLMRRQHIEYEIVARAIDHLGVVRLTPFSPPASALDASARKAPPEVTPIDSQDPDAGLEVHELSDEVHSAAPHVELSLAGNAEGRQASVTLDEGLAGQRWHRRSRTMMNVTVVLVLAVLAGIAVPYFLPDDFLTDATGQNRMTPLETPGLPVPPVPSRAAGPVLPSPPPSDVEETSAAHGSTRFVIDVALFSTVERASRLGEELASKGFRARTMALDLSAGRRYVVLVGGYSTREEAAADLSRLHQMPGYADATIMAAASGALQ